MKHTIRRDLTVIDFGSHYYPDAVRDHLSYRGGGSGKDEFAGRDRMHDPAARIAEMRESGIDAMVHSMPAFMGIEDADLAAETNDALLDVTVEHDEFYALASIPAGAGGEAAAAEFERCLENGFNGGALDETEVALTDDEMQPVFDVAVEADAPIFVHVPTLPYIDLRFNATFGRERALQESIAAAVHRGLYDRYPDLNLVWHHLGGNIAAMVGRIHLHTDPGRWPLQENLKSFEEFKTQLEAHVYVDTAGFFGYTGPVRIALEEFPATQLLFGTDYPGEPRSGEELDAFANAVIDAGNREDAAKVLGGNALELLVNVD